MQAGSRPCSDSGRPTATVLSPCAIQAGSTVSTRPNRHDFSVLNSICSHLDPTTTVESPPAAVAAQQGVGHANVDLTDKSSSWGALVKQSANGRSSIYTPEPERFCDPAHVYWPQEATESCAICNHPRNYRR